ncbi:MAG: PfkB family carbohydrate kinase [Ignavibacteriaceae bacterium]|nr:PfkB family carbohydrate kinase [Ignavibacteriaceae bacterium]
MKNITAIGEIIFDIYPGYKMPGGAPLNFIYHINKLTGKATFISRVGADTDGKDIVEFLEKSELPISYIQTDKKHDTGAALANLDENKIPHWEIPSGRAYDFIEVPTDKEKIVQNSSCFYFGSLAQRMEKSRKTIQSFFDKNMKYFFDINIRQNYYTKDILETSLQATDVLKVNDGELKLLHDLFIPGKFDLNKTAYEIITKFDIELAAITMGGKGAWIFTEKEFDFYNAKVNNIVDTTGAGDAYSAILCMGYLNKMKPDKINRLASDFASEIIKIQGAIPNDDSIYARYKM